MTQIVRVKSWHCPVLPLMGFQAQPVLQPETQALNPWIVHIW